MNERTKNDGEIGKCVLSLILEQIGGASKLNNIHPELVK